MTMIRILTARFLPKGTCGSSGMAPAAQIMSRKFGHCMVVLAHIIMLILASINLTRLVFTLVVTSEALCECIASYVHIPSWTYILSAGC